MLFSIIVPVHNGQKYIKSSVESVINQNTDEDYEIIIVENGSTDETASIVDEIASTNNMVTALHMGPIGLYAARQEGIKKASGDYIIALDSDDEADPALIRTLSGEVKRLKAEGLKADIIYYNVADMDNRDKPLYQHPLEGGRFYEGADKKVFCQLLCEGDSINSMWSKCISKDIAYLGEETLYLNYGEDLYQTVQYVDMASSILFVDSILYYYRQNDVSISSTYSDVYMKNQKVVWAMVDKMVSRWNIPDSDMILAKRKSLTCAIEVAKIVQSGMSVRNKKAKLKDLLTDDFYVKFHNYELTDWAPEESVFYHDYMCREDAFKALSDKAFIYNVKSFIKRIAGK